MASSGEFKLTFLRGSGFLHSLIGEWDLMADETGHWPSQKGFLIFDETKIIVVIERSETIRRGIEGAYSVEGNRILMTEISVDTAPERGAPGDMAFELDGDLLTITWLSTTLTRQMPNHVDRFRRRPDPKALLPPQVAIYDSGGDRLS